MLYSAPIFYTSYLNVFNLTPERALHKNYNVSRLLSYAQMANKKLEREK